MVSRRTCLNTIAVVGASSLAGLTLPHTAGWVTSSSPRPPILGATPYQLATLVEAPHLPVPDGKRLPFGWRAFAVPSAGQSAAVYLRFGVTPADHRSYNNHRAARLRLSVAIDVREEKTVEVFLARSQRAVGRFDIRYAAVFQPFELLLNAVDTTAVLNEGIGLRQTRGTQPLWVFHPEAHTAANNMEASNTALLPHLLFPFKSDPQTEFYQRVFSFASVQAFGWMEGCVLDGMLDLASVFGTAKVRAAAQSHLRLFFDDQERLVYERPQSIPVREEIYGIEGLLPFAALGKVNPRHPALQLAIDFCLSRALSDGTIQDANRISTEGCYTVAYPLAVLAGVRKRRDLAELAIKQLLVRKARLVIDNAVLQSVGADGSQGLRNWGRGVAWYLLGLARCLPLLERTKETAELRTEYARAAQWALRHQQANGLWSCFIDEPATGIDTSGSAGIAAALAIGANHRLLPSAARQAAVKASRALKTYLTPDGWLTGVAQANKGGAALQRGGYRVIAQFAMGLMAQLAAALSSTATSKRMK